jgi:hypothetical protein
MIRGKLIEDFWRGRQHGKGGYELRRDAPHREERGSGRRRGTSAFYKREHVRRDGAWTTQDYYAETDELPVPHPDLPESKLRAYRELPLRWA